MDAPGDSWTVLAMSAVELSGVSETTACSVVVLDPLYFCNET